MRYRRNIKIMKVLDGLKQLKDNLGETSFLERH